MLITIHVLYIYIRKVKYPIRDRPILFMLIKAYVRGLSNVILSITRFLRSANTLLDEMGVIGLKSLIDYAHDLCLVWHFIGPGNLNQRRIEGRTSPSPPNEEPNGWSSNQCYSSISSRQYAIIEIERWKQVPKRLHCIPCLHIYFARVIPVRNASRLLCSDSNLREGRKTKGQVTYSCELVGLKASNNVSVFGSFQKIREIHGV